MWWVWWVNVEIFELVFLGFVIFYLCELGELLNVLCFRIIIVFFCGVVLRNIYRVFRRG